MGTTRYAGLMQDNRIFDEHVRRNRTTRERWDTMASHRARVIRLLKEAAGRPGASLCVLGAGNANDIDLGQLARDFQRIVLVDLDDQALASAVGKLSESESGVVECRGRVDLSGILSILASWDAGRSTGDRELMRALEGARATPLPDVGTFDVVCSTCVLTQLIDSICLALPPDHPQFLELVLAVRNRHLDMIAELLNPGGGGVLLTDFVSTTTAPEIAVLDEAAFPQAARWWIDHSNFFTGANPFAIQAHYRLDPSAAALVEELRVTPPWRWDVGARQFAVCGVTFRRRQPPHKPAAAPYGNEC